MKILEKPLNAESALVKANSMEVLKEFENMDYGR